MIKSHSSLTFLSVSRTFNLFILIRGKENLNIKGEERLRQKKVFLILILIDGWGGGGGTPHTPPILFNCKKD